MADQTSNIPQILFSDTESEEEFEGFTARDARPYVEIAVKAPLFCSTSAPKAKRARVGRENHWSTSSDDDPGISPIKLLPTTRTCSRASSTSSVKENLLRNVNRFSMTRLLRFFKSLKIETRAQAA